MAKLAELIEKAKCIKYIEPKSQNIEEWTSDELVFKSINIALQHDIQIKAGLYICKHFPPLKIIYNSILTQYINYFIKLQK